jgi:hypothetical protein
MTFFATMMDGLDRLAHPRRRPKRNRSPQLDCKPRLELLEDRLDPATVNWNNLAGGD